jgi:hypothetical protein
MAGFWQDPEPALGQHCWNGMASVEGARRYCTSLNFTEPDNKLCLDLGVGGVDCTSDASSGRACAGFNGLWPTSHYRGGNFAV